MTKYISTLVLMFLACFNVAFSQGSLDIANKQYANGDFNLALSNYNNVLNGDPENQAAHLGIARAFSYTDKYDSSIKHFKIAESISSLKQSDLVIYGNVYRKMGKYQDAAAVYNQLKGENVSLAQHYRLTCDYAEYILTSPQEFTIVPFSDNSKDHDYAMRMVNNQFYWMTQKSANYNLDENKLCPEVIQSKLNSPMPDFRSDDVIPTSENAHCFMMCDLASLEEGVFMQGVQNQGVIVKSEIGNTYLSMRTKNAEENKLVPYAFNSLFYSVSYPQLTEDGKTMYFSSDMPGGFGGFDLYFSKKENGEWTEPTNLGPVVNSMGDEITPFYDGSTLYFASDYLHGLGGFDLFKSESYNGKFTFPSNLGNGINSSQDDIYPFFQVDSGKLYFSSNRVESQGGFDIFEAFKNVSYSVEYLPKIPTEKDNDIMDVSDSNIEEGEMMDQKNPKAMAVSSDWEGAVLGAFEEDLFNGTPVFFIQLAAVSNSRPEADPYKSLAKYGNIYVMNSSNTSKIRLGYFFNEKEAREVLTAVKGNGFKDAFLTSLPLDMKELELLVSNASYDTNSYMVPKKFKGTSGYKVRLASYENPKWFNIAKAKDIGKIEQWSKGGWTIFVLSGYRSQEEANKAKIKAINKGFVDAEVVFDNNGLLEKIQKN